MSSIKEQKYIRDNRVVWYTNIRKNQDLENSQEHKREDSILKTKGNRRKLSDNPKL